MEHELWSLIANNQARGALDGVGLHTTVVLTSRPDVSTPEGLENYKRSFLSGLENSVRTALLAAPQYLVLGFSLEHILSGLDSVRDAMAPVETYADLAWTTWQDAAPAALGALGARRIGLLTPFDEVGNASATKMFEDLGFDVVTSVGMACGNLQHIAHIPDWAKERAVLELLATTSNRLDAVVQCGTNMSMLNIIDRLESVSGVPIVAINPVLLWHALREAGIADALHGGGTLLRSC
jgi:maleate isomerase